MGFFDSLVSLGSTLLTNRSNQKLQQSANQANLQLAREQNQFNLDMWNKANEYNSPAAQVQRMREAGLNPNLMYGSGAASVATADTMQSADLANQQAPRMQGMNPTDLFGTTLAAAQMGLQYQKQKHEIVKLDAESEQVKAQVNLIGEQVELTKEQREQVSASIAQIQTNTQSAYLDNIDKVFRNKHSKSMYELAEKQAMRQLELSIKDIGLKDEEKKRIIAATQDLISSANLKDSQNLVQKVLNQVLGKIDLDKASSSAATLVQSLLDTLVMTTDAVTKLVDTGNRAVEAITYPFSLLPGKGRSYANPAIGNGGRRY